MNIAWHKLRYLVAVLMAQTIILSQACSLGICIQPTEQPVKDRSHQLKDGAAQDVDQRGVRITAQDLAQGLAQGLTPVPAHSRKRIDNRAILTMMPPRFLPPPPRSSSEDTTGDAKDSGEKKTIGLKYKLSLGKPAPENKELPPAAHTEILSETQTDKLLKLLPPLLQDSVKEFLMPAHSVPPPNNQSRINEPFPPHDKKTAPTEPTGSPLLITSKRPVGSIDHASAISITFSQPMVPITIQSSIETKTPPASISPALDGKWTWFGTQTLTFAPTEKQLPMSTLYEMKVPAGTASVTGGKLTTADAWNFSTSTVELISSYPDTYSSVKPSTLIMARFNQKINEKAILAMIRISARGQSFPVVSVNQAEIDSDKVLKSRLKDLPKNTFVVFKTSATLPLASTISVKIGPQIKSAEGPLLSKGSVDFHFLTYGALKVMPQADYQKNVLPDDPICISFSNHIDRKTANALTIAVSPPIADCKIACYGDVIRINGTKKPNRRYQVQLSGQISDTFGQKLAGGTQRLKVNVKHVYKQLYMPDDLSVLSSKFKPKFALTSVNLNALEMSIYAVAPEEYAKFQEDRYAFVKHLKAEHIETLKIMNVADQAITTNVDLGRWLDDDRGSIVISFKSHEIQNDSGTDHMCWVQYTNIGLDAFIDGQSTQAWVTDLASGLPIKGAEVSFAPSEVAYQTDANGLVTVPLTDKSLKKVLVARYGKHTAIVGRPYAFSRGDNRTNYLWYVVTDRSPYRPGEKINVKGILRKREYESAAELSIPRGIKSISYTFKDSGGNEIGKGNTDINKFGGFDLSFSLPTNVNLGNVELNLIAGTGKFDKLASATHNLTIHVAEFRRPEFELKVRNEGASVQLVKGATTLAATTNYFAGGGLANANINWTASSKSTTYSPPGWSEFQFGRSPFLYLDDLSRIPFNRPEEQQQHLKSTTDGSGKNYLHIDYLDVQPSEPSNLTVSATVQDVNRQTWTDTTTLLVHPSELYAGTKLENTFAKIKTDLPMSIVVTNIDGKAIENIKVNIDLYRVSEEDVDAKTVEKKDDLQKLTITSAAKPVQISLQPKLGGLYKVVLSVTDSSGRRNETISKFWCDGGTPRAEATPGASFNLQKLIVLPEKSEYRPGDKAVILVQSPFYPAEGLATLWHDGLATTLPFHMNESSYRLNVPISEHDIPQTGLQIDLLGIDKQSKKTKNAPAEATGSATIKVSSEERKLSVAAKPDVSCTAPGNDVSINIDVTDHTGACVANAEVAVAVVDDALLSLVNYEFSDPLQAFYPAVGTDAQVLRERENLDMTPFLKESNSNSIKNMTYPAALPPPPYFLSGATNLSALAPTFLALGGAGLAANLPESSYSNDGTQFQAMSREQNRGRHKMSDMALAGPMMGSESAQGPEPVQLRSNFNALAKWAPSVVTDEKGHAEVKFKLPDNLTRYRVMAVASSTSTAFGYGDSILTVRLPLMLKPSAPRFLNYGDHFELPVVLRNQTDTPIEVNFAARAANAEFTHGQGRHTKIPANDRVEIRLPASTVKSGTARFQVIAAAGTNSDAAEFSVPVYTPATTEAFATYGQIENGAIAQSIETPKDLIPDFGSLELTTSTTVLETLTDAFIYLQHYPFECSEQISSRLISISLIKDMLKEFHAAGLPGEQEIKKTVSDDLQKLQSRQQPNGSFALWRSTEHNTYPYVTLNVAQALILTKKAGYEVNSRMLEKTMQYLKNIDNYINDYTGRARIDLKVLALYIRDKNGDTDISAAHALLSAQPLDKLSLESMGFLLQIFAHKDPTSKDATTIYTYLSNSIVETASTAEIVRNGNGAAITCSDYRLFDSPSRVKAILLDSLLAEGKTPEIVTKLMRSLLSGQIKGRWRNTQENAYVLLAMRHYFDKYEKTEPDLLAEAWLGKAFIGDSAFKGRTNDFKTITVPMTYLSEMTNTKELILKKSGNGRLYYRLGLNYAPKSLHLSAMDRGFKVTRTYEGVTNKDDVKKDGNGVWQFKPGSLIKVKLNITASSERFFVAVVDPLPAGAEALNQDLNGTESVTSTDSTNSSSKDSPSSRRGWSWWTMNWWNHENKRDNQTEVFADRLWGGSHEYSYLMRATTPGTYVVPPTKAEEMYAPETFGRTASETVIIN